MAERTIRIYNGGDRFSQLMGYSREDGHDNAVRGYHPVDVPEHSFFELPTVLFGTLNGSRNNVYFLPTLLATNGKPNGLVVVDKNATDDEVAADAHLANSEKQAVEKSEAILKEYWMELVQIHLDDNDKRRAAGQPLKEATGYTKKALKALNIEDPGAKVREKLALQGAADSVDELKKQVAELTKLVQAGAKK